MTGLPPSTASASDRKHERRVPPAQQAIEERDV